MPYAGGRIYRDTTVDPPLGVSVADVQRVLATSKCHESELCTHPNINMWAKYKPETPIRSSVAYGISRITLNERILNGYSIEIKQASIYGSVSRLVTDLRNGSVADFFVYRKPTGGQYSPYRISDFEDYWHEAPAPIKAPYNVNDRVWVKQNGDVDVYYYVELNGSTYGLGLTDLRLDNDAQQLGDYYFGILIYDSGSYFAATQQTQMKYSTSGELLGVTVHGLPQLQTTYQMVPFISTLPFTSATATFYGSLYPMTMAQQEIYTRTESRLVVVSTYCYVISSEIDVDGGPYYVYMDCSVVNLTDGSFTFSTGNGESYVELGPQSSGLYVKQIISKSLTAPANGQAHTHWTVVDTNLNEAVKQFIRNGDTRVSITGNQFNGTYIYNGIVEIWEGHLPT